MQKAIIFYLCLLVSIPVLAQDAELLSESELMKKPLHGNLMYAFKNYDKIYRFALKGTGGIYGKVDAVHPEIDSLVNLQYFQVVNEALKDLPDSFGALEKMQYLYLSGNKFTSIPDTIFSMKHLKRLDMQKNQIIEISPKIGQLTELEFLYLNNNPEIKTISLDAIKQLSKLKYLNLKGTQIPHEHIEAIRKKLPGTEVIEY